MCEILLKEFILNISAEFFIIILLLIYILYLQIQVSKKNLFIKSHLENLNQTKHNITTQDIIRFLENLKYSDSSAKLSKDKMLDKRFSDFLFENDDEINLYLHYTAKESIAKKIITEGFKFVNSFYKTAEYIYNDELYLIHRHHEHKQYGPYVLVICISKKTFNYYSHELSKLNAKNISVEQILTEKAPFIDENADEIYTCPKQFIKGYFNYLEGTIKENTEFDFNYNPPIFNENLKKVKSLI